MLQYEHEHHVHYQFAQQVLIDPLHKQCHHNLQIQMTYEQRGIHTQLRLLYIEQLHCFHMIHEDWTT